MTAPRRMGVENSQQRTRFVDAAEQVLREEGYHAISARHVAATAGLKTQLLYYYFRTMDDLLLAVVRRINERRMARFEAAVASEKPLRALWEHASSTSSAGLANELTSIAGHRDAIRDEIVFSARDFRLRQIAAVRRILDQRGLAGFDAAGLVTVMAGFARTVVTEHAMGLTEGHAEALALVEAMLARLGD